MWADNETTIDLLGFDYLVDSLEVLLTEPRLLPVTIGVLGDWGSGKTSLLRMVGERLDGPDYVVVEFSPWRYQAYEDVKAALMDAVLAELGKRVPGTQAGDDSAGLLHRLRGKVARMMAGPAAAGRVLAPTMGSLVAAHENLPPEFGAAAGSALLAGIDAAQAAPDDAPEVDAPSTPVLSSVADFREEFEALIDSLEDVRSVVVLIDDLDRCLDDTVVDVFEAIRLFLQVSSTAFVIAANREIVQAAVERRYPAAKDGDPSLGKDYLEKIVQIEVTVPPLAEPEAETYLNLLFADLRLDETAMEKVCDEAQERRREGQFAVAMNYGIAKGVLGDVPAELEADFVIANRIAPTLSRGLRGNPRQLKRFLNIMLLRLETARRRGVALDPAVLAKLMVLERSENEFQQLFLWQLNQDGAPDELHVAEAAATSPSTVPTDASQELKTWFAAPVVGNWLALEPALGGVALGQYFFFSRDRLSPAAPGARLAANLQALLSRLQLQTGAQRRTAVEEAAALVSEEYAPLFDALLERARRRPEGPAMDSALELAGKVPTTWPILTAALTQIPPKEIPSKLPPALVLRGADRPEVTSLLDQWERAGIGKLKKAVIDARSGLG